MKLFFIGTYSCLAMVGLMVGAAFMLGLVTAVSHIAWGIVGALFLAVAATCLWMVCGCGLDEAEKQA